MMLKRIRALIAKWNYYCSYDACYKEMENRGIAVFGLCEGLSGGDINSGYLQYGCIQCPHLCFVEKGGADNG